MGNAIAKTFSLLFVCAALIAGTAFGQAREKPVGIGEAAPDFTLVDQDGRKHSLAAERGKRPVVLIFYRGYW
ncbi:AhpC/TSA family protein [compost metagenome]